MFTRQHISTSHSPPSRPLPGMLLNAIRTRRRPLPLAPGEPAREKPLRAGDDGLGPGAGACDVPGCRCAGGRGMGSTRLRPAFQDMSPSPARKQGQGQGQPGWTVLEDDSEDADVGAEP